MTRKIFLDVGAFNGETIRMALNPIYSFDYIHGFEPSPKRYSRLRKIKSSRVYIYNFGLSDKTYKTTLYGVNTIGASVYPEKRFKGLNDKRMKCEISLNSASLWISQNTQLDDQIYLKLNCEGAEVDILQDLIDTKLIHRVKTIYVDFDIRKVKDQEHRQDLLESQLKNLNIEYFTPENFKGSGLIGVDKWLALNNVQGIKPSFLRKIGYILDLAMPFSYVLSKYAWRYTPRKLLTHILKLAKPNLYS
jgi:FkbM family methyltransferase